MAVTTAGHIERTKAAPKVPDYLVKEIIDGIPVYFKGYRDVLAKTKQPEEIMADGLLQAMLKMWLSNLLFNQLSNKYWIFSGEVGSHISRRNNMAHDLAIFDKGVLPSDKITRSYADVPAKVVLEIDTDAEYGEGLSQEIYIHRKTQTILDFGTERVIWIFTSSRKILIAQKGKDWTICDWDKTIEILDGVTFNVAQYLGTQGVAIE